MWLVYYMSCTKCKIRRNTCNSYNVHLRGLDAAEPLGTSRQLSRLEISLSFSTSSDWDARPGAANRKSAAFTRVIEPWRHVQGAYTSLPFFLPSPLSPFLASLAGTHLFTATASRDGRLLDWLLAMRLCDPLSAGYSVSGCFSSFYLLLTRLVC